MNPGNLMPFDGSDLDSLLLQFDEAVAKLAAGPALSKPERLRQVFDIAQEVMTRDMGCAALETRIQMLENSGVFEGSDWATPGFLIPTLARYSLQSPVAEVVVIESLSELRFLAVAKGDYEHPDLSSEQATHFLTQVLASNLSMLFSAPSESERETQGQLARIPRNVLGHLAQRVGYEQIIDQLIDEIWRILNQRPIQVDPVKHMITQIAVCQADSSLDLGSSGHGAARLISSLYGPTQACRDDPGVGLYLQTLESMDTSALLQEATGFARAMHDTGLVSPYHATLLRYLWQTDDHLLPEALGLSMTGRDCLLCYRELVYALINEAVHPETPQAIYGLALMLERGILFNPGLAPGLWRQLALILSESSRSRFSLVFGDGIEPRSRLLEGVLCMLGQPLGVGQGNNPTCQSVRALSMWAYNDPGYLLQMVVWAARDDEIIMHFEGQPISSRQSESGVAQTLPFDLDAVSLLVVPHLDRIYAEMGRRCIGRTGDPHRWVNPEFHGWWSGRGFRINVDVATGALVDLEDFLRHFYAAYHPYYNGNQPLIHPQPAGIAVTNSAARFIGWHAITVLRIAMDPEQIMRVYFFNPNNDSGQDWGDGVVVKTAGTGERYGEASLPFAQFASRLYIFHFDPLERGELALISRDELDEVVGYVHRSWGVGRVPAGELQANSDQ